MPITFDQGIPPGLPGKPQGDEMDLPATHQRLLVGAALRTQGPILELGVGWYSTPLLHEIATAQRRNLLTVDNNADWLNQFLDLESLYHRLLLIGWWGDLWPQIKVTRFGLAFIDQGQGIEREYAARALLSRDLADVFVFHDTEEGYAYGYDRVLGPKEARQRGEPGGMFRYQWTDSCQKAWTTVASNAVDVTEWFTALPPVEPTKEVT